MFFGLRALRAILLNVFILQMLSFFISARSRSESVKTVQVKARAQKRNSFDISAKQGTRKSLDSFRKVSTSSH